MDKRIIKNMKVNTSHNGIVLPEISQFITDLSLGITYCKLCNKSIKLKSYYGQYDLYQNRVIIKEFKRNHKCKKDGKINI